MAISDELQNYADGLGDAYDAAQTMGAIMPAQKNMNNLDATILTIPQPTVNDGTLTITQNGTSAGSFTANQASNTTISLTDTTYSDFGGATYSTAGSAGLVPAPAAGGDWLKFLCGDGSWSYVDYDDIINTPTIPTYSDFTGATSSVAGTHGLVPAPTTSDPDKFLKGDGSWGTPAGTTYTAGTNVQISSGNVISATDTTYSNMTGATASTAGTAGLVPAPAAGDQVKVLHGDGTWKDTTAKLVEMSYGESNAWTKFINAYNAGSIVYCRASSNANPATGSQTRKAFMAYVSDATNPTNVEFQYVRSVSSKTSSQPVDQVFIYKLTNASGGTWSVATRDMAPKLAAGTNASVSYSNGTYTVSATDTTYSDMTGASAGAAGVHGLVPAPAAGDESKVLQGDGTWVSQPTVNDATLTIQQNGTTVDTFTANSSTNKTVNIVTSNDTYSTTEVDTGKKWIDGKTIYRRAYSGTAAFTYNTASTVVTDANVKRIIGCGGYINDGFADLALGHYHGAVLSYSFAMVTASGLDVRLFSTAPSGNANYDIWVEYTKSV